MSTTGDQRTDVPIWTIGGTGVFVKEVQEAVLDGRADLAVHSAKDLPSETAAGLVLAAVPERADPRDALVGSRLADIPAGGRIGTGSVRRQAQLAALRPTSTSSRSGATSRPGWPRRTTSTPWSWPWPRWSGSGWSTRPPRCSSPRSMLPQIAQGALAVECRADDAEAAARLAVIDDSAVHRAVDAERAFLRCLGGGCDLPCGALADARPDGTVALEVLLATLDGKTVLRARHEGPDPERVGTEAARILLDDRGGRDLL